MRDATKCLVFLPAVADCEMASDYNPCEFLHQSTPPFSSKTRWGLDNIWAAHCKRNVAILHERDKHIVKARVAINHVSCTSTHRSEHAWRNARGAQTTLCLASASTAPVSSPKLETPEDTVACESTRGPGGICTQTAMEYNKPETSGHLQGHISISSRKRLTHRLCQHNSPAT